MAIIRQFRDYANGDARIVEVDSATDQLIVKSADGVTTLARAARHLAEWSTLGALSVGDSGQPMAWPIDLRLDLLSIRVDSVMAGAGFVVEVLLNGSPFGTPIIQTLTIGSRQITSAAVAGTPTVTAGDEVSWTVNSGPTGGNRPEGFHMAVAMMEV